METIRRVKIARVDLFNERLKQTRAGNRPQQKGAQNGTFSNKKLFCDLQNRHRRDCGHTDGQTGAPGVRVEPPEHTGQRLKDGRNEQVF